MPTIALLGALDTKLAEYLFVKERVETLGHQTLLIDIGVHGAAPPEADVSREQVATAGGSSIVELQKRGDRGEAMAVMSRGAAALLPTLHEAGKFHAVLALGGSGGTSVACAAMRALPIGVPKVMVSTVAGGDVSGYVGVHDIVMIPSIVDVSGLNRISRRVFSEAAAVVCAMASAEAPSAADRPLIAASMFGNTTRAVETARAILEKADYEVLVFHSVGTGGATMERLIDSGAIAGVLDITTTEWADELCGGVMSAGPHRLEAAARRGVPAVVAPGCLDMVNFGAVETVPKRYRGRTLYQHNPNVTLMRTNTEENRRLGEIIAEKLNASRGPVSVVLPLKGLSVIGAAGQPFHAPDADGALFDALREHLRSDIPMVELDCAINDPVFAETCAMTLLRLIGASS